MLVKRRFPKLAQHLRLVHPDGTEVYFAYFPDSGVRYEINEVAFRMMSMMTGENETGTICSAIENEFNKAESVVDDMEEILEHLVQEGCVEILEK